MSHERKITVHIWLLLPDEQVTKVLGYASLRQRKRERRGKSDRIYTPIKRVAEALTEDMCDMESTELYETTQGKQSISSA